MDMYRKLKKTISVVGDMYTTRLGTADFLCCVHSVKHNPHACRLLHCNFFIFFVGEWCCGEGGVGGVRSVGVGVQFQPAPSRRSKGGGKPESVSRKQAEMNTKLFTYFTLCSLCKVILLLSTGL
jgi:hypothetical protein